MPPKLNCFDQGLSVCLCLCFCLSVCVSLPPPPLTLFVWLSVSLSGCLCVWLAGWLSVCLCLSLSHSLSLSYHSLSFSPPPPPSLSNKGVRIHTILSGKAPSAIMAVFSLNQSRHSGKSIYLEMTFSGLVWYFLTVPWDSLPDSLRVLVNTIRHKLHHMSYRMRCGRPSVFHLITCLLLSVLFIFPIRFPHIHQ